MEVDSAMGDQLASVAAQPNQKDRITSYLELLRSFLSPDVSPSNLITFGRHFTTSSSMAMVVGRRVLGTFVAAVCAGSGMTENGTASGGAAQLEADDEAVVVLGSKAFDGEKGRETRQQVVEGVLEGGAMGGWCDEQTTTLRHLLSHLLLQEEDFVGAARALMQIPLEGGARIIPDEEKLAVYMQIVRCLLEAGESGSATTYFNRASLLINSSTDKETFFAYRLSQARLNDFSARFNEAAQAYHKLSFESAIDDGDRLQMLSAAVTTSILAPAGPQRSRILASLNRDERVQSALSQHLSTMLTKMLLEYIVRPAEVEEFERGLAGHQRALVEGGGTVLERAVREHNVGACGKVYDNISFDALGAILGLDETAAESTARRMIEQGRLRAWIDQPLHVLYFESRSTHDTDADAQGTAGGLGVEREAKEVEPVSWTERWDDRIRATSMKVEALAMTIQQSGLIPLKAGATTA